MFDHINYLYGIGLGPGDPELITLKALRILRECDVLLLPDSGRAMSILEGILTPEELGQKEVIPVKIPMTTDSIIIESAYADVVNIIWPLLDMNKTVGYLTIGDPTIYSSFIPIKRILEFNGYRTKIINGIPSFLAVSAACNEILVYGSENLCINPSTSSLADTRIYMKKKHELSELIQVLANESDIDSLNVFGVSDCGLSTQRIYKTLDELLSDPPESYYTTIIVRHKMPKPI